MSIRTSCRALGHALAFIAIGSSCDAQAAAVVPPTKPFVIVANQRTGVATLVEVATGRVSHVDLGADPHEVAVSPDGRIAALTIPSDRFGGSRKVVALDLATAKVVRTIDVGTPYKNPHGVRFISDSVALVGTLAGTSTLYVDIRNGRVLRSVDGLPANPYVIALTTTGRAYVSSPHSSKVTEIDVAAGRVTRTLDIPNDPSGIAVSADGKELYAAVWRNDVGGIVVYDLEKGVVSAKLPATEPRRIAITADARFAVVSDRDHLRIIERASRQLRSVVLGQNAFGSGVACSPDSTRCYVALSEAGEIVEVDVNAGSVLRRFAAQKGADGVAYVAR